jgi:hypothetical protein
MRSNRMRMSWRVFLGGMAALLGVSATATELVVASAEPVTTDHAAGMQPQSAYVPGTYSSCTAKFGLWKGNADLASFDVVDGSPAVLPSPVLGSNLIPLITVSDGSITEICEAQIAWTDAATFDSAYIGSYLSTVGTAMPYPGRNDFWIMPAVGVRLTMDGLTSITVTTRSLSFGETLPAGSTVTLSAQPQAIQVQWSPYMWTPASSAVLATPYFQRIFDAVESTGGTGQRVFLEAYLAAMYDGGDSGALCANDPSTANATFATMDTLGAGWASWLFPMFCGNGDEIPEAVGQTLQFNTQVSSATALTVTVAGPPLPTTTTLPTTSSTTTTDPVVPQFTG